MSTLYRKVLFSERLPDDNDYHDTNNGAIYCWKGLLCNQNGPLTFTPDWWLEEVTIPADEEIEKIAESFANKKWDKYCDGNNRSFSEKEQDIYDKIIGISHTEYDYKNGFKEALELLTKEK